jgi:hypothetical protein
LWLLWRHLLTSHRGPLRLLQPRQQRLVLEQSNDSAQ